jgi:four helix bundle protein
MKIKNFEEMQSWQAARRLANQVYSATRVEGFERDWALRNQIRAAAGSVMHNIAEGFESGSDAEFARFLRIARRSASEVQSQAYLALDQTYISEESFRCMYDEATAAKRLINGMLSYLEGRTSTND